MAAAEWLGRARLDLSWQCCTTAPQRFERERQVRVTLHHGWMYSGLTAEGRMVQRRAALSHQLVPVNDLLCDAACAANTAYGAFTSHP
jgi:hypothetical protein